MGSSFNDTPRSDRLHIGIFGKRNSGKSSLVNALTNQEAALVSPVAGTTTDPVYKAMEIHGIGPVVLIDTAGFDDQGELGEKRVERTKQALEKTDVALVVFAEGGLDQEAEWIRKLKEDRTPVVAVLNKADLMGPGDAERLSGVIMERCQVVPILASAKDRTGMEEIRKALIRKLPEDYGCTSITEGIVDPGDTVLLVMPQDIQAPKGRLILPQVQTMRDLLDKKCQVMCATTDRLDRALKALGEPPKVIITDSQAFQAVYEKKPKESKLTSFSILFANYKGDLDYYIKSAQAIDQLTQADRVLIAEACTHAPLGEDIGRDKIPRMLRKRAGQGLLVDVVAGQDFPKDLRGYKLVVHCGGCMFNRKYVMSRIEQARSQGVPMTNYGVALAYLAGILDHVAI